MASNAAGAKTLLTFSPRWTDEDLLERTLAGRRDLVDRLEHLAHDGAGGPNKHQQLIIGVRGSGKTHVLKVLHNRLWKDEGLKSRLLIVYLLEDELGIATFLDFLVRLLRAIVNWYPEESELAACLNALHDLPAASQASRAKELLLAAAGTKDVLVLMENLGITFDKTHGFGRKGQEALRDLVQQHPRFMIFATAQALTQDVSDHDYPFFGFFKITHLAKLTIEEAHGFLASMARAYGKPGVVEFLQTPEGRGRVEAIYLFTGGNHRLLVTFFDFLSADSVAKIGDLFLDALNPLRPFYQEQMRSLSAQQQKIVQYLALARIPQTVKEIARGCLATSNTISKQLGELMDRGFLNRVVQGRESYYEMSESLFRICYEADLDQQGAPVRLFVDFLANFYTAKELQLRCRGFRLLGRPFDDEEKFYSSALARFSGLRDLPLEETVRGFFSDLQKQSAFREIVEFGPRFGEDREASILTAEALAYAKLGKPEEAAAAACKAIERDPNDIEPRLILSGLWFAQPDRQEAALAHAARVCELAPADARGWLLRCTVLGLMGRTEEVAGACDAALAAAPGNVDLQLFLGMRLAVAGRPAEALKHFDAALAVDPDSAQAYLHSADALRELGHLEEAEARYSRVLEIDAANLAAAERLGTLLRGVGRYQEALEQFDRLVELAPGSSQYWGLSALAAFNLGRTPDAEVRFRRSLSLDANNPLALEGLAIVLWKMGRHSEVLEQAEKLVELNPNSEQGHFWAGLALEGLGRPEEAALRYREALEQDGSHGVLWSRLVRVLAASGQTDAAMQAAEDGLRAASDPAWIYTARGEINRRANRFDAALADYEEAIRLDPSLILPHFNAITALIALGRAGEFAPRLAKAIDVYQHKPDPRVLTDRLQRNLVALFCYAAEDALATQLSQMAELIQGAGLLAEFDQALSLALFSMMRDHSGIEESRFRIIQSAISDALSSRLDTTVVLRLLDIGIRYFKRNDRKALLTLAREERELFVKELGIADSPI
jgi:tetratricopeptide (TPR) repeat protein